MLQIADRAGIPRAYSRWVRRAEPAPVPALHAHGHAAAPFHDGHPSMRFEPASGEATLSGVAVETDDATGLATKVAPVRRGGRLSPAGPDFW